MQTVEFQSSGSTGQAKRIVKSLAAIDADVAMLSEHFRDIFSTPGATVLSTISREHMYGRLWLTGVADRSALPVYPQRITSPEEFAAAQNSVEKAVVITTPSFLEKLFENPLPTLRRNVVAIFTSGALLRGECSARAGEILGVCPTEIFGSTEAGSVACRNQSETTEWTLFPGVAAVAAGSQLQVDSPFCISRPFVMSDNVEFTSARTFRLLGRSDRMVKLLEHLIDLADVETALTASPYIERAHAIASDEAVPRIWALIQLNRLGLDTLKRGTYAGMSKLINDSLASLPTYARPRRYRFLREFPFNPQGKLPHATVLPILKSPRQEPVITDYSRDGDTLELHLTFPPDNVVFNGHFPSFPILPGVAQLFFIHKFAARAFQLPPVAGRFTRLKFQNIVRPGVETTLRITRQDASRYEFHFSHAGGQCASGIWTGAAE